MYLVLHDEIQYVQQKQNPNEAENTKLALCYGNRHQGMRLELDCPCDTSKPVRDYPGKRPKKCVTKIQTQFTAILSAHQERKLTGFFFEFFSKILLVQYVHRVDYEFWSDHLVYISQYWPWQGFPFFYVTARYNYPYNTNQRACIQQQIEYVNMSIKSSSIDSKHSLQTTARSTDRTQLQLQFHVDLRGKERSSVLDCISSPHVQFRSVKLLQITLPALSQFQRFAIRR